VELPNSVENLNSLAEPNIVEEPNSMAEQNTAKEPNSAEKLNSVSESNSLEEPKSVEEPSSVEEPKSVEEPSSVEEPKSVEELNFVEEGSFTEESICPKIHNSSQQEPLSVEEAPHVEEESSSLKAPNSTEAEKESSVVEKEEELNPAEHPAQEEKSQSDLEVQQKAISPCLDAQVQSIPPHSLDQINSSDSNSDQPKVQEMNLESSESEPLDSDQLKSDYFQESTADSQVLPIDNHPQHKESTPDHVTDREAQMAPSQDDFNSDQLNSDQLSLISQEQVVSDFQPDSGAPSSPQTFEYSLPDRSYGTPPSSPPPPQPDAKQFDDGMDEQLIPTEENTPKARISTRKQPSSSSRKRKTKSPKSSPSPAADNNPKYIGYFIKKRFSKYGDFYGIVIDFVAPYFQVQYSLPHSIVLICLSVSDFPHSLDLISDLTDLVRR
jgi:hypothetical protein